MEEAESSQNAQNALNALNSIKHAASSVRSFEEYVFPDEREDNGALQDSPKKQFMEKRVLKGISHLEAGLTMSEHFEENHVETHNVSADELSNHDDEAPSMFLQSKQRKVNMLQTQKYSSQGCQVFTLNQLKGQVFE